MKRLIEKHQKSRGKLFSSELAAKMESRLNPTKSVSDTTNEVTKQQKLKQRVSSQNTKEKVLLRKSKALSPKEIKTHRQYEQAALEAATDSWYNPRRIISNASSIPLVGLPFTIAKSLYGGMNYLLGNEGKAKYWWDSANQDAFGQNIALGAIPAHINPYTAAIYDGALLGPYMKELDQLGKFQYPERLTGEDKTMLAMSMFPYIKPEFNIATLAQRRAAITAEQLANRKFFPVKIYGKKPIYTREEAQKVLLNKKLREAKDLENPSLSDDVTYYEENVGLLPEELRESTMAIARRRLQNWRDSPHGRIMETSRDYDYSTASFPQSFKFALNRHLAGDATMYPVNRPFQKINYNDLNQEGVLKPGYTLLNQEGKTVGIIPTKKLADEWNIMIREANLKTGLKFPEVIYEERWPIMNGNKVIAYSSKPRIFTPAFGIIKHKNGNKIHVNIINN